MAAIITWNTITLTRTEVLEAYCQRRCEILSTWRPIYWPTDRITILYLFNLFVITKYITELFKKREAWAVNSDNTLTIFTLGDIFMQENLTRLIEKLLTGATNILQKIHHSFWSNKNQRESGRRSRMAT